MSATDGDIPAAEENSAVNIIVEDEAVLIVGEDGGMEELTHFQRSETIMNMLGAGDGTSVIPVTRFGIKLWQTAVDSMLNSEIWHLQRAVELSMVAHVRMRYQVIETKPAIDIDIIYDRVRVHMRDR